MHQYLLIDPKSDSSVSKVVQQTYVCIQLYHEESSTQDILSKTTLQPMWIDTSYWIWTWTHQSLKTVYLDNYGWWRYIRPSNQVDKSLDLQQNISFKGGSPPNLCKPDYLNQSFFLAFPNLGTRFLLRVVVCNIPDF